MTDLSDPFVVIPGNTFLAEDSAVMLFAKGKCTLRKVHKHYTIHSSNNAANTSEQFEHDAVDVQLLLSMLRRSVARELAAESTGMVSTAEVPPDTVAEPEVT